VYDNSDRASAAQRCAIGIAMALCSRELYFRRIRLKSNSALLRSAVLLLIGFLGASRLAADVTGKVTLDGTPPEMKVIDMAAIKECAALHPDPVTEETVIVGDKGELKNVVVSLKKDEDKEMPGEIPKTPAVLDQKDCMFQPHVLAMMVGQELVAKNSDNFLHNVHAQPAINDEINFPMPHKSAGEKIPQQPKAPETFRVKCDVHPWMSAWIAVFDHPYFSVTGDDGTFDIKNLPDGQYTLQAWHELYGTQEQKITVKEGKAEVNFTFKADAKPAPAKKLVQAKTGVTVGLLECPACVQTKTEQNK
jgi:plastocyanin